MVENQAIARVLRLGQTRNVKVVRYIMKGTVEEVSQLATRLKLPLLNIRFLQGMRSQQTRKLDFAKA